MDNTTLSKVVEGICSILPVIIFSILFFWNMREERKTLKEITENLMWHIGAKGPKEVAEAKAMEAYEEQALRQQQAQFERVEERIDNPQPRQRIVDEQGHEYEVLAGMD